MIHNRGEGLGPLHRKGKEKFWGYGMRIVRFILIHVVWTDKK